MANDIQNDGTDATILAAEEASVAVNNENYAQMTLNGWTQITQQDVRRRRLMAECLAALG